MLWLFIAVLSVLISQPLTSTSSVVNVVNVVADQVDQRDATTVSTSSWNSWKNSKAEMPEVAEVTERSEGSEIKVLPMLFSPETTGRSVLYLFVIPAHQFDQSDQSDRFDLTICRIALIGGAPPGLIKAIIAAESAFNSKAYSEVWVDDRLIRMYGLMQVTESNLTALGVAQHNFYDPKQNIWAGVSLWRSYYERFGSTKMALQAYHCGPYHVLGGRVPKSTSEYVEKVLGFYLKYKSDFQAFS